MTLYIKYSRLQKRGPVTVLSATWQNKKYIE